MSKKEKNEKKKSILLNIITVLIILGFILFFFNSEIFNITEIKVEGNLKISTEEIEKDSGIKKGTNIFTQSVLVSERILSKNPRIYKAHVKRNLPNVINIKIEERKERYQISRPEGYFVIDHSGFVLRKENIKQNLILIKGIEGNLEKGTKINESNFDTLEEINKIYNIAVSMNIDTVITGINASDIKNGEIIIELEGEAKNIKLNLNNKNLDFKMIFLMIKEILKNEKGKSGDIIIPEKGPIYFREKV